MKEKVTVIVPVYNAEKYLEKCVNSIINQTYSNIEIILINDGSTDNSYSIMKCLQQKDNRIKIFSRENKGTLYTRLEAVNYADGKYIMYVDSDDYIELNMIEELIENGQNADIIRCDYFVEDLKKKKITKEENYYKEEKKVQREEFKELYYVYINTYQYSGIWAQLIKKDLLKKITFEKTVNMCEDLYINLELLSQVKEIVFIPKFLYHYIIRENSTCRDFNKDKIRKKINDGIYIYCKFFEYIKKWNIENEETKTLVANRIIKEAYFLIKNLFYVSFSKDEVKEILNETLNNEKFNEASLLADKTKMSFLQKLICKKQYSKFYFFANITIKPIYKVKQMIKRIIYR